MKEDFRNPNSKYMKIEDVIKMNIPALCPIEVVTRPHCQDDINRGEISETNLLYYAGVEKQKNYDTLRYYEKLIDGKPIDNERGIMLPIIDSIIPLKRTKL